MVSLKKPTEYKEDRKSLKQVMANSRHDRHFKVSMAYVRRLKHKRSRAAAKAEIRGSHAEQGEQS